VAGVPSRSLAWVTAHPRHPVTRIADPFCLERRRHRVQRGRNRRQIHEMTLGFEPPIQGRFLGAASTTPHLSMCHVSSVAARGWECNPAWVGDVRTLRTGDPFLGARISLIDRMAAAGGHPLHWNGALTCPSRLLLRLLVLQSLACPPGRRKRRPVSLACLALRCVTSRLRFLSEIPVGWTAALEPTGRRRGLERRIRLRHPSTLFFMARRRWSDPRCRPYLLRCARRSTHADAGRG